MPERLYREDEEDDLLNRPQPVGDPIPEPLPPVAPAAAAAAPPPPRPALTPGGGQGQGGFRYTGYDFQQDAGNRDPNKSAKYALASLFDELERQGIGMPKTHADAASFAQQHIVPGMAKYGYNVRGVDRDRFTIDTRENDNEVIDWLVNAGGENPEVGWQSNAVGGGANQGLTGPVGQLRGLAGGEDILSALLMNEGLGGSDLLQRIQAELQKLLAGTTGETTGGIGAGGLDATLTPEMF